MLYYSDEVAKRIAQIAQQSHRGKLDAIQAARQVLAIAPELAPATLVVSMWLQAEGKMSEAEELLWSGLRRAPCFAELYMALGAQIYETRPKDPAAGQLIYYGFRKAGLSETLAPSTIERMAQALEDVGPTDDPKTYLIAAEAYRAAVKGARARKDPRLLPLHIFDALQQEAENRVEDKTLKDALAHAAECEPLFYAAVRQWANESEKYRGLRRPALHVFLAIIGETGGPERIADLLELAESGQHTTFLHVHWAIWRLGQRFPAEALKTFRAATRGATVGLRCALAEHLNLLPETAGVTDALAELLKGFGKFTGDRDAPYLLALATNAMAERGAVEEAHSLLALHRTAIGGEGRDWLDETIDGDEELIPTLVEEEIPQLAIEDVVLLGALDEGDEDENEDEEEEDEFEEDEEDLSPDLIEGDEDDKLLPLRVLAGIPRWFSPADQERANLMFHGNTQPHELTPDEADALGQFLMLDFRDEATGKTLLEHFMEEHRNTLSNDKREALESLHAARYGLYEIDKVEKGRGVQMRDVFDGTTFFVEDVTTSRDALKGDCALVRVQKEKGRYVLAGNGTAVRPEFLHELREFVALKSREAGQGEAEFVQANSHLMRRQVVDWHRRRMENLKVLDAAGDEFEFGAAVYQVLDRTALLAALRQVEELHEGEKAGGVVRFIWAGGGKGPSRRQGTIEIGETELKLETTSRRLLELGRGLIEYNAGRHLKLVSVNSTTMDDIKRNAFSGKSGPPRKERPPSKAQQRVLLDFKEQHYAGWADEKLPAFRGKSARQMVKTPAGREEVLRLLRTMERDERRGGIESGPPYDFNKIRRKLGLPEE